MSEMCEVEVDVRMTVCNVCNVCMCMCFFVTLEKREGACALFVQNLQTYLLTSEQLYMLLHVSLTKFLQIQRHQNGINQCGHPIALVSMVIMLCETGPYSLANKTLGRKKILLSHLLMHLTIDAKSSP